MKTDKFLLNSTAPKVASITLEPFQKNTTLWQTYQAKKADMPMLFPTEGAKLLGVSEFELLLSSPNSVYLGSDCRPMLLRLHELGQVENIVRNEFAVHEKTGQFLGLELGQTMGMALNQGGLDLRVFLNHFKFMLAIVATDDKPSYQIAFFDEFGQAVDKVFLNPITDEKITLWQTLTADFAKTVQKTSIEVLYPEIQGNWQVKHLDENQKADFHHDWLAMTDIHQFYKILSTYQLDRQSSYVNAPSNYTKRLNPKVLESLLSRASEQALPLMIFVGNTGMVQIYAGTIKNIKKIGHWLNIMDKKYSQFTLHLNDKMIESVWWIRRPHSDGYTIALEGFDKHGNSIITIFGERTEGQKQDPNWQVFAEALAAEFAY
ncbi:hemin-degrading factor [Moraxella bovis]|uniref:Hemin-degrading factor n=1 Tax=Moraxella bovis TaxID=476 RepID=A0AAQ2SYV5_MORBO|nr:ChuX/HutX family heme-like substrate-binding protein [Moraxella bovis]AWY20769.1 hemin-degrading factor [Moraxella bovis]UYZ76551.1 hemin-degrading factor [Moraxella bovis]UYZ77497.1 hemin-degrading factor [Moraxella bovis]UYZ82024.1 hemin-degrading factor [Moraxella bovis]UYZ85983.1 hemin-degrading factor [Moraxella bovis]